MEPKRYIFLRRRRMVGARLMGIAVSAVLVSLPAELEPGVAAEPEVGGEGGPAWIAAVAAPRADAGRAQNATWSTDAPKATPTAYDRAALRAFAASAAQMIVIRERWRPVLERAAANGPDEAAEARRAQGVELAQAVRDRGITPARYREIFQAAQRDPRLKSYLLALVRSGDSLSGAN